MISVTMEKIKYYIILLLFIPIVYSCGKDEFEPYDVPFIHIMKDEISTTTISAKANVISTYHILLSSKPLTENLIVDFILIAGEGLQEGVDYELLNSSNRITFLPGIYEMPVRIRWMANPLNPGENNSLTIRIENNNLNLTMGLPGAAENQREFTIQKVN